MRSLTATPVGNRYVASAADAARREAGDGGFADFRIAQSSPWSVCATDQHRNGGGISRDGAGKGSGGRRQ
jgi:hypothetical protein